MTMAWSIALFALVVGVVGLAIGLAIGLAARSLRVALGCMVCGGMAVMGCMAALAIWEVMN